MSDSSQPHGLWPARFLCPPLSPRVCSNLCSLSQWCYLAIFSSATPFFFCLQSFPASGSFPVSHLFASCGQSIGASASATVLPVTIQGWFPLGLIGLFFLQSKCTCSKSHLEFLLHSFHPNSIKTQHPSRVQSKKAFSPLPYFPQSLLVPQS